MHQLTTDTDYYFMQAALELAQHAQDRGEVPVGAVVVQHGIIIGRGYNRPIFAATGLTGADIADGGSGTDTVALTGNTAFTASNDFDAIKISKPLRWPAPAWTLPSRQRIPWLLRVQH
jgi:hypothetical protein